MSAFSMVSARPVKPAMMAMKMIKMAALRTVNWHAAAMEF
jgi:hypothetical protein